MDFPVVQLSRNTLIPPEMQLIFFGAITLVLLLDAAFAAYQLWRKKQFQRLKTPDAARVSATIEKKALRMARHGQERRVWLAFRDANGQECRVNTNVLDAAFWETLEEGKKADLLYLRDNAKIHEFPAMLDARMQQIHKLFVAILGGVGVLIFGLLFVLLAPNAWFA